VLNHSTVAIIVGTNFDRAGNPHTMDFAGEICISGCRLWLSPSHP